MVHVTLLKRALPLIINFVVMAVCLFGSAGRVTWLEGWILIGLSLIAGVSASIFALRDPELLAERRNLKAGKSWDKVIVALVVFVGPVATWITAGLDVRHGGPDAISGWASVSGMAAALIGGGLVVWAMRTNRFFSAIVRIQKDRGQTVITAGPYRFVRHPGYAGMVLFLLATPLILRSGWAFVPATITLGVMILRTALEDLTLQNELAGYTDYARRVKNRLVPFVW